MWQARYTSMEITRGFDHLMKYRLYYGYVNIYNIYIYIFNDRNRYILSSLGALAGIILATSWPRFGWWIPIDWLATTNFRLGPECHSAGDMISSISYFMGLLCFVFISVCFFNIRSRFIVLSGPCFMWHVFRNAELQRAGLHSSETTSGFVLAYGKSRQKFTWACWKMEGIIPDGSCFSAVFFKKNHFPEQCQPSKIESFSWRSPLPKSYTSRSEWLKVVESQPLVLRWCPLRPSTAWKPWAKSSNRPWRSWAKRWNLTANT